MPDNIGPSLSTCAAVHQRISRDFPTLVPDTADFQSYSGFLHVRSFAYRVRVSTILLTRIRGDAALRDILTACSEDVRHRISAAPDAHALLIELRDLVERVVCQSSTDDIENSSFSLAQAVNENLPSASYYEGLLRELDNIGWSHVHEIDETMRHIKLSAEDVSKRVHVVSLALPVEYPDSPPRVSAALPEQFTMQWTRGLNLCAVLDQFRDVLKLYQDIFDIMDDLDERCWVLEPERPLRSDVYRRIALGKHCSLRIELDPRAPHRAIPECRFLGSDAAVGPLRDSLNSNMHLWDTSGKVNLRDNLQNVLGSRLPEARNPADLSSQDMGLECGICYSYRLNEMVPDVACDRGTCAKPFHRTCLVEWLKALPDTRQSFETLFGACPYCDFHISVSLADV
jgi:E3 ubiquitin-protein ligase FANCL